ncbi:WD40 repeat domain-containing protein, partial [Frankia sp. CiP3]|uniref:WD40 repeat domain-containing protein n=1 Tax=Frankia sp. CiP3 TaxID=2880971 RepID=UPI001EF721A0
RHPANAADRVRETANKLRVNSPDLARKLDLVAYHLAPSPAACAGLVRYSFVAGSAAVGVDDATRVALSPDGRQLAVASVNTVRIFSLAELAAPREILSPLHVDASNERIFRLAFGADGRTLVAGTLKSVFLWDLAGPPKPRVISSADPRNAADVSGLAVGTWSEDGTPVPAVALARGTRIELWKTGYGFSRVGPLEQRTVTTSVALSPDARRLAGGGKNGVVLLWTHDAVDKPVSLVLDEAEAVTSLAFSRDGERIATGTVSGKFTIWDLTDSTDPAARISKHLFHGQDGEIDSVMFGGRDTVVVAGNSAGAIRLWDVSGVAEPTALGFLDVRGNGGAGLATSADGLLLAAAVRGGGVQLWNLDPVAIAARLCKDKAARITDEEWAANLPGEPVQAPCP